MADLSDKLQHDAYNRLRWNPETTDVHYLTNSDLREAMNSVATDQPLKILDYGCGGSPYRALFPNAHYLRADFIDIDGIDFKIRDDQSIDAADGSFDIVVSTQVAEHIEDTTSYFHEIHRLLKPGGKFICTTHGTFEEHGCPFDFRRWTSVGLTNDLQRCGFKVDQMTKLTTGPRAVLYFFGFYCGRMNSSRKKILGLVLSVIQPLVRKFRPLFHRQIDAAWPMHRIVSADESDHPFFVILFAEATKP